MYLTNYINYIILIIFINPYLINGFLFWPFYSSSKDGNSDRNYGEGLNSLFGTLFPFIKWNRSPVFGINAYKEIDMGDAGEFRNDFEFRIGPKPKVITHGMDERLEHDQYILDQSNNVEKNYDVKRLGRAEYGSLDYPDNFNFNGKYRFSDENIKFIQRPEELQVSPR